MSELKISSPEKFPRTIEGRKAQIIELIRKQPRRWAELKNITGLGNSTLFRILTKLENDDIIQQKYEEKKLIWVLTEKGTEQARNDEIARFLGEGVRVPLKRGALMKFDCWTPRNEPLTYEKVESQEDTEFDAEDKEYSSLEANYILDILFKGKSGKKAFLARYAKEDYLAFSVIAPEVIALHEPSNPKEIEKFSNSFVRKINNNVEKLFRWFLPKKGVGLKAMDSLTNKVFFVFEVEMTFKKDKLREILESQESKAPDKTSSAGT